MTEGITSSESLRQSINFCLHPPFALERKGHHRAPVHIQNVLSETRTHLVPQVTAASSFMAMQASLHAASSSPRFQQALMSPFCIYMQTAK